MGLFLVFSDFAVVFCHFCVARRDCWWIRWTLVPAQGSPVAFVGSFRVGGPLVVGVERVASGGRCWVLVSGVAGLCASGAISARSR